MTFRIISVNIPFDDFEFNENEYYQYIQDRQEISFNEYGIVETKKLINIDNMNKLKVEKKITEKNYDKRSGIGKLLKSLEQKINSPKTKRSN